MAISVAKQIQNQLAKRGKGVGLRVADKKVGGSGFAYTFSTIRFVKPQ